MKLKLPAGIALAALTGAAAITTSAFAADLGGSIKDGYVAPMPEMVRSASGNCYFRADVGYSAATDASIDWAQTDPITGNYLTSDVSTLNFDNGAFGEAGVGCGSGSRGLRGEIVFGFHGSRKLDGEPATAWYDPDGAGPTPPEDDPLHTEVTSYTLMLNAYKDLGNYGGFTPYIGAGVGMAYNKVDDVYFTGNPALVNSIHGDNDLSFAWSLMAGVGYQISDRAVLDLGYRYADLGSAQSERVDTAGFVNPRVDIDDLTAHEFKVGLRYYFGQAEQIAYQPMK